MKTNRLASEKSPYLLQHQHNPVDWHPWGEEAFEKARAEKKPIFLSIGYSTCHWCHVMERESFENEAIAALLNAHFVSIKVDREERPDVDRLYMTFVQATTGSGGWPLSAFLTPELKPFFGGTYFPPEDRWGRIGFPTLLQRIAEAWEQEPERLAAHGEEVAATLLESSRSTTGATSLPDRGVLDEGFRRFEALYDEEEGGFSHAPKFPRSSAFHFLARYQRADSPGGARAREMLLFTLRKMARGGIFDHLGGGFHRYSVDRLWHVPHYEKMLYDQALLSVIYIEAFQISGDPREADVARAVLDYVARDLTAPEGGFYCAEDADSLVPETPGEKAEGAFYIWTQEEIESLLPPEAAALFCRAYGVELTGNSPEGSDPHGELEGKNTLILRHTPEELAALTGQETAAIAASLAESRRLLFHRRSRRPRPHLDDKLLTGWNGLMISAFAKASRILPGDGSSDLERARRAATFLRTHLWKEGRLLRSWREGAGSVDGFTDDYAFLIAGLLDLYEASAEIEWLQWAADLQGVCDHLFYDDRNGGYYATQADDPHLFLRMKEDYDAAEPSANSVAAANALRLSRLLDDETLRLRALKTIGFFARTLRRMPDAMPQMLGTLDLALRDPVQIVLSGTPENLVPFQETIARRLLPEITLLYADAGEGQAWLSDSLPYLRDFQLPSGVKTAAALCRQFTCQPPLTTPEALSEALQTL